MRVATLVPLLFCSVNSSAGWQGHGRVDDDGSLSPLPRPLDLGKHGGYLALPGRAALLGGPIFCFPFIFCMGIIKIGVFYLSYWLHLMLIVCGNAKSNPGPGSDKRAWVLYSNIHGLHANSDELAVALSNYVVLVCAESKVFGHHHLSELHIQGFGCPNRGCGTPSWCPLSGSLCLLMIPLFLAESCVFESYV